MNLLCYTLFKTGTHTLRNIFKKILDQNEYNLEYKHIHNLKRKDFDIIFITIRSHLQIYPSAYFQDITKPQYEYSYFRSDMGKGIKFDKDYYKKNQMKMLSDYDEDNELLIINLINHFMSIEWTKYSNINYKYVIKYLNDILENKMDFIEFNKNSYKIIETYHQIMKKDIKIVFIDINMLNDINEIEKMLNELSLNFDMNAIENINTFNGSKKWYKNIYGNFKNKLKETDFYKRYDEVDNILHNS